MIEGGYYIKARKIQESEISKASPCVREIWDWLLREANHADTKVCKRGELFTSYDEIISGLCWYAGWRKMSYSRHDCENSMKYLRKRLMITTRKTTRGLFITIVKYDYYQNPDNYKTSTKATTNTARKPQHGDTIHNNDKNEENDNKIRSDVASHEVVELIESFKEVNPMYSKWFANKTQRSACERLIKINGLDKLKKVVEFLPKSNATQYMPVVTSPLQLEDKFSQLASAWQKLKNNKTVIL